MSGNSTNLQLPSTQRIIRKLLNWGQSDRFKQEIRKIDLLDQAGIDRSSGPMVGKILRALYYGHGTLNGIDHVNMVCDHRAYTEDGTKGYFWSFCHKEAFIEVLKHNLRKGY